MLSTDGRRRMFARFAESGLSESGCFARAEGACPSLRSSSLNRMARVCCRRPDTPRRHALAVHSCTCRTHTRQDPRCKGFGQQRPATQHVVHGGAAKARSACGGAMQSVKGAPSHTETWVNARPPSRPPAIACMSAQIWTRPATLPRLLSRRVPLLWPPSPSPAFALASTGCALCCRGARNGSRRDTRIGHGTETMQIRFAC